MECNINPGFKGFINTVASNHNLGDKDYDQVVNGIGDTTGGLD